MCTFVWRSKVDVRCFIFNYFSSLFFETGPPTEPGVHQFSESSWSISLRHTCVCASETGIAGFLCGDEGLS